jgi:hypothetical protein
LASRPMADRLLDREHLRDSWFNSSGITKDTYGIIIDWRRLMVDGFASVVFS